MMSFSSGSSPRIFEVCSHPLSKLVNLTISCAFIGFLHLRRDASHTVRRLTTLSEMQAVQSGIQAMKSGSIPQDREVVTWSRGNATHSQENPAT